MKLSGVWEKLELYILSLWLLFFLIIVVTANVPICLGENCSFVGWGYLLKNNIIPIAALIFLISGFVFYFRFNFRVSGSKRIPSTIVKIEDHNYEHLTFLTTYIIPLICFNLTNYRYVFSLVFLLFVIGVIYVRTDKFYANPTLAVLGFRLYKVTIKTRSSTKEDIIIILKSRVSVNDKIRLLDLDEKVSFAMKVSEHE